MLKLFNKLIVALLPIMPKFMVSIFAKRYVAGTTPQNAIEQARSLNERGFDVTLDILGEHVTNEDEARAVTEAYVALYDQISQSGISANISIKPTHLGLDLSQQICADNLMRILTAAKKNDNFLRIDMENSPHTDATIALYQTCLADYDKVGVVFQAYLYRTKDDMAKLDSDRFNFRLCKGIYHEPEAIAIQDRQAINANYLALVRQIFGGNGYVALATHDLDLIDDCVALIDEMNMDTSRFEFQVLYGVPMKGKLEKLLMMGYKVRVYIPFGEAWYEYSSRRLKENPDIAGYVLGNLFRRSN